jgi:CubicO group peptidase (beta-lactamase class C family)
MKAGIDRVIDEAIGAGRIVGTVVLVARDGELVYARAAGFADREAAKPVAMDTIFRLASVTKPIVAATALALVDKGRLGLDDLVRDYLAYFTPRLSDSSLADIKIRHLLTHTAGLTYDPPQGTPPEKAFNGGLADTDLDFEENFRRLSAFPLLFAPGTGWSYSIAIDVLGAIIAKIEGCPLDEAVKRHVAGPLGMMDTGFTLTDAGRLAAAYADGAPVAERMPDPYSLTNEDGSATTFSPSRLFNHKAFQSGGAGMVGTGPDMLAFFEAIRSGGAPILTPETVASAMANQIGTVERRADDAGQRFGFLGAVIDDPALARTPMAKGSVQWGGIYGHSWFIDPLNGISAVMMSNTAVEGCAGAYPKDITRAIYLA